MEWHSHSINTALVSTTRSNAFKSSCWYMVKSLLTSARTCGRAYLSILQ